MIALGIGESEEALFEDRVLAIPQCECKTEAAFAIRETSEAVLAPAISAAAGVLVREIFPGGAAGGIILADGAPLPFGKIRAPVLPMFLAGLILSEAVVLGGVHASRREATRR